MRKHFGERLVEHNNKAVSTEEGILGGQAKVGIQRDWLAESGEDPPNASFWSSLFLSTLCCDFLVKIK